MKMITMAVELTFYKDQEKTMEAEWEDMLAGPENTIYLVCEDYEDPQKYGKVFGNLAAAKKNAGWL